MANENILSIYTISSCSIVSLIMTISMTRVQHRKRKMFDRYLSDTCEKNYIYLAMTIHSIHVCKYLTNSQK